METGSARMPTDRRPGTALPERMPNRCRTMPPCRDARGRVRRGAALLPDPGEPVPEGPGRQGHRLERRDQQDRDGGAAARRGRPAPPDAVPELDTRGALTRLWDHLKKGQKQRLYGWFQEWADIEAQATVLGWYEPLVIPGLLQTEEYARAILSARPDGNLDDLDEQVAARPARQAILDRTGAPQLWCILDEGVLHRAIGGSKVMRSQLYRLAEVAEHPKTTIRVIRSGGAHAGLLAHFVIADLEGKPSVVYLETAAEGQITDSSSVVDHAALRFDRLRAQAESWVASRDLIRKVAEERWT